MAEISLRKYVKEIDNLIENGRQIDQAIQHCRHILKEFPRHVATYRLLGKAFLEKKSMAILQISSIGFFLQFLMTS